MFKYNFLHQPDDMRVIKINVFELFVISSISQVAYLKRDGLLAIVRRYRLRNS